MQGPHDRHDHDPPGVATKLLAPLAVACLAGAAPVAAAEPGLVLLPPATAALAPGPPLLASVHLPEQRVRGTVASRARVLVGVGADGTPRSVRVVQRLTVLGRGDYIFAVGAPAVEVRAGPGSQSKPGFRADTIIWQGFSAGRRVLSADATLRVRDSLPGLPVRLRISGATLVVENVTGVRTLGFTGRAASFRELGSALRQMERAGAARRAPGDLLVHAGSIRPVPLRVDVRLVVTGVFDGRRVAAALGGGLPSHLVVRGEGSSRPRLRLVVRPVYSAPVVAGAPTLDDAVRAALRLARLRQFDSFLSTPTPLGRSQTLYEYRFATPRPAAAPAPKEGGWSPLAVVVAALAAVGGAAALLALWARS